METHYHKQIDQLRNRLLEMSFVVEDAITKSCDALLERNARLASEVIDGDETVNLMEIEIDRLGHDLFALGPVAQDLRKITMILKINTDLERIGDHAVNIADKTLYVLEEPVITRDLGFEDMSRLVQRMFRDALNSFLKEDVDIAQHVLKTDDKVDQFNRDLYVTLKQEMKKDSSAVGAGINLLMVAHNLERIADLSSNIAEDVIFLKQGREIRHRVGLGHSRN